jgi:hypothetical protein
MAQTLFLLLKPSFLGITFTIIAYLALRISGKGLKNPALWVLLYISFLSLFSSYASYPLLLCGLMILIGYSLSFPLRHLFREIATLSLISGYAFMACISSLGFFLLKNNIQSYLNWSLVFTLVLAVIGVRRWIPRISRSRILRRSSATIPVSKARSRLVSPYRDCIDTIEPNLAVFLIIALITYIQIISSLLTSNIFDDLNGYLYFPLQSIIHNTNSVDPSSPASINMMTAHSQYIYSLLVSLFDAQWLASSPVQLIQVYKSLNFVSYSLLGFCSLYDAIEHYSSRQNSFRLSLICIMCILPSTFIPHDILTNTTYFPLILFTLFASIQVLNIDSSVINAFSTNDLRNIAFLLGVYSFIQPKLLSVTFPLYSLLALLSLFNIRLASLPTPLYIQNIKQYIYSLAIFAAPLFITTMRSYFLTGNPTFPKNNLVWNSDYFGTSGIVADKFYSPLNLGFNYFYQLLTNNSNVGSYFYAGHPSIYGYLSKASVLLALITILVFTIFLLYGSALKDRTDQNGLRYPFQFVSSIISVVSNSRIIRPLTMILIGLVGIIITRFTVGDEHRYFASPIFFTMSGLIAFSYGLLQVIWPNLSAIWLGPFLINSLTSFSTPPLPKPVIANNGIVYGTKRPASGDSLNYSTYFGDCLAINSIIDREEVTKSHLSFMDTRKVQIILSYDQGRLCYLKYTPIELDWYSYAPAKHLNSQLQTINNNFKHLSASHIDGATRMMIEYNKYYYAVLTPGAFIVDKHFTNSYYKKVFSGASGLSLYKYRYR